MKLRARYLKRYNFFNVKISARLTKKKKKKRERDRQRGRGLKIRKKKKLQIIPQRYKEF